MKKNAFKDKGIDDIYCHPILSFERHKQYGGILQCTAKKDLENIFPLWRATWKTL